MGLRKVLLAMIPFLSRLLVMLCTNFLLCYTRRKAILCIWSVAARRYILLKMYAFTCVELSVSSPHRVTFKTISATTFLTLWVTATNRVRHVMVGIAVSETSSTVGSDTGVVG